jgi:2-oxoglutarate/2-oxoacid ferredoxin oxidoreductase subunit alpha
VLEGREVVLVPELNSGQFAKLIRAEYLVDAITLSKIQGDPFKSGEIETKIEEICREINA